MTLLQEMTDYMDGFKHLLDTAKPGDMDTLIQRFDGFYRFAKLLEHLAEGIRSGEIKVPK